VGDATARKQGVLGMREFQLVTCPKCEGSDFVQVGHLKHKPGAGLIFDNSAYACLGCKEVVDASAALQAMVVRQKREELRLLEQELGIHG